MLSRSLSSATTTRLQTPPWRGSLCRWWFRRQSQAPARLEGAVKLRNDRGNDIDAVDCHAGTGCVMSNAYVVLTAGCPGLSAVAFPAFMTLPGRYITEL